MHCPSFSQSIALSEIAHSFTHSLIPTWCMAVEWTIPERGERIRTVAYTLRVRLAL